MIRILMMACWIQYIMSTAQYVHECIQLPSPLLLSVHFRIHSYSFLGVPPFTIHAPLFLHFLAYIRISMLLPLSVKYLLMCVQGV